LRAGLQFSQLSALTMPTLIMAAPDSEIIRPPFRSSPTPSHQLFCLSPVCAKQARLPPFEAITPSNGTRPASCRAGQGCGSSAASHLPTSRKALRASAGRRNAHLPRPCLYRLSFIVILPHPRASMFQPPRHLDIGAVCKPGLKEQYRMAQSPS